LGPSKLIADSRESDAVPPKATYPRPALGTSRLVRSGRVVIEYFENGSGETVILLPAFASAASDFNELAELLNGAGYRTVAVELRGMGRSWSPWLPRSTMRDFAVDVSRVIEALDGLPTRRVHLLGQALGNRIARAFAVEHPELVQSVVLLGAGGKVRPNTRLALRYYFGTFRFLAKRRRLRVIEETLFAPGNKLPSHLDYRRPWRAVGRQLHAAIKTPLEQWWSGGQAPMLVLQGELDRIAPPPNAYVLSDQYPDRVKLVMIAGAGHALLPEQPETIGREIVAFLREHRI
jgi:pimeloyl-ACP methyl ester carboxylesterase